MTPDQVFHIAAIAGAAGVLIVLTLGLIGWATGLALLKTFEHLRDKRAERQHQREEQEAGCDLDTCNAILALPEHDPRDPR